MSIAAAVAAAGHAVVYKRDPRSATIWVLLIGLLPLGGSPLYLLFGINVSGNFGSSGSGG